MFRVRVAASIYLYRNMSLGDPVGHPGQERIKIQKQTWAVIRTPGGAHHTTTCDVSKDSRTASEENQNVQLC